MGNSRRTKHSKKRTEEQRANYSKGAQKYWDDNNINARNRRIRWARFNKVRAEVQRIDLLNGVTANTYGSLWSNADAATSEYSMGKTNVV